MNSSRNHYSMERIDNNFVKNGIINLHKDFLSEEELSLLFSSADAVILPYKVSSGSGVMFDALAHGLPFVATDLDFFKEFSSKELGITVKRDANAFSKGLVFLDKRYATYKNAVEEFRPNISWQNIASQHGEIYNRIAKKKAALITVGATIEKHKQSGY
jgi:glycosyltransferase involved in cell wall biosynthesis